MKSDTTSSSHIITMMERVSEGACGGMNEEYVISSGEEKNIQNTK